MENELIRNPKENRRHVVILGAGASYATLPNGDTNGQRLPIMNNLVQIVGLQDLVSRAGYNVASNFEDVYAEMYGNVACSNLLNEMENRVYEYFSSLKLPDHPTVYDYLVLSLRRKDVIATFNWDPLLVQAWDRCHQITKNLPHLLFLHGNVRVGVCHSDRLIGSVNTLCPACGQNLKPSKLLYPIKQKNYDKDPFIAEQWNILRQAIEQAYALTIFGYGAPKSDVNAVQLMKHAWGKIEDRSMEQIDIIDIKSEDELVETWKDFIHTHHYETHRSFFDSHIAKVPRRTVEAYFEMFYMAHFIDTHDYPQNVGFDELREFIVQLTKYES